MGLPLARVQEKEIVNEASGETMLVCTAPLGAREGNRVFRMLLEILGPMGIPLLSGASSQEELLRALQQPTTLRHLGQQLENATKHDESLELIESKFKKNSGFLDQKTGNWLPFADSGPTSIDVLFAGRYDWYYSWFYFCLEVNFKSFLGVFRLAEKEKELQENN